MRTFSFTIMLVLLFASCADAASKYGDGALGVKFGDTLETVKARFPRGSFADGTYSVENPDETFELVHFAFTDDNRLSRINRVYSNDFLKKAGGGNLGSGVTTLLERLLEQYGAPESVDKNGGSGSIGDPVIYETHWREINGVLVAVRAIDAGIHSSVILIIESVSTMESARRNAARKADFGF